jgi:hypothetical protein
MLPTPANGLDLTHIHSSNNSDSCSLLTEDFGKLRDIRKLCLIVYSIGKTPGYILFLGIYGPCLEMQCHSESS